MIGSRDWPLPDAGTSRLVGGRDRQAAPRRAPGPARSPPGRRASGTAPAPGPVVEGTTPLRDDRCRRSAFSTTRCWSANAATWGRWVTTITWAVRASRASRRPISTAALPPDTRVDLVEHERRHRVGTGEHHLDGQHHPATARRRRRPCCSGSGGAAGCGGQRSSTSSTPCGPKSAGARSTVHAPPGRAAWPAR